jgi:hypothetical protein
VWEAAVNERVLRFFLAGINNQNFLMQDEQTGSWWQQVTGMAILGPLRGQSLRRVDHGEISFGLWKAEKPGGRVLRPDSTAAAAERYAKADWEARIAELPVVTPPVDQRLQQRALVAGIYLAGHARAYPLDALREQGLVSDRLGGVPLVIVVADDGRSVRAFDRRVDGRELEFIAVQGSAAAPLLMDAHTGSLWDFTGLSVAGSLAGRRLDTIFVLLDYWFDWTLYNPGTDLCDVPAL